MSPERAVVALILALAKLSDNERLAFVCHTLHGWTYMQIGQRLGVSHERARQYENAAQRKLAAELEAYRAELIEGLAAA